LSPLPASGEGIKGWGAMTVEITTNYADMISLVAKMPQLRRSYLAIDNFYPYDWRAKSWE